MIDWDEVVALGTDLPGVELGTSYGRPALKVRGKMIAAGGKADDHFVLRAGLEMIELLKADAPAAFFQTPHYEGWPAVLVAYATADRDQIAVLIAQAWDGYASKAQKAARRK
jgi:hypothetical protein